MIRLVRQSHNGDRATVDYRHHFQPTRWATDPHTDISDQEIDKWIGRGDDDLCEKSGGFERSLPEFDEFADQVEATFGDAAAIRVAAAGLGGSMIVHVRSDRLNDLLKWFAQEKPSWRLNIVENGPATQIMAIMVPAENGKKVR